MVKAETIKGIAKTPITGAYGVVMSILQKVGFKWSFTLILVAIIFGSAIVSSIQERDPVIFFEEFGGRIALSDHSLEVKTKEIINNPQITQMNSELRQYDSSLPLYKKIYIYPVNLIVNTYTHVKYFIKRFSVFFDLIANLWFLFMLTNILMLFALKVILQDDSKTTAAWITAVILMILIQMVFSAMTFDVDKPYSELTTSEKINKITPFRGTLFLFSHLPEILSWGMDNIVEPIKPFNQTEMAVVIQDKQNEVFM